MKGSVTVTFQLEPSIHKALKMRALKEDKPLREMVSQIVTEHVQMCCYMGSLDDLLPNASDHARKGVA